MHEKSLLMAPFPGRVPEPCQPRTRGWQIQQLCKNLAGTAILTLRHCLCKSVLGWSSGPYQRNLTRKCRAIWGGGMGPATAALPPIAGQTAQAPPPQLLICSGQQDPPLPTRPSLVPDEGKPPTSSGAHREAPGPFAVATAGSFQHRPPV